MNRYTSVLSYIDFTAYMQEQIVYWNVLDYYICLKKGRIFF